MEQEKIRELLEKYYEGTASEYEEYLLKEFLQQARDLDISYAAESRLLCSHSKVTEPSEGFMSRLEAVTNERGRHTISGRILRLSLSSAAAIVLLVASYLIITDTRSDRLSDSYSDPALAMAEVKNILYRVSDAMNTGTGPLNAVNSLNKAPELLYDFSKFNKATEKSLEKLQYLNMLDKKKSSTEETIKK